MVLVIGIQRHNSSSDIGLCNRLMSTHAVDSDVLGSSIARNSDIQNRRGCPVNGLNILNSGLIER